MTYPRHSLISLKETPYYHVVARCVRRAWLWGYDPYAGKDYSHRKDWVLERLSTLSDIFSLDICAYAVMSNHYHLVLHVDKKRAQGWSAEEVIYRWSTLFGTPELILRLQSGIVSDPERKEAQELITLWRSRLSDISWYMRCLNEYLARRANEEDGCKGRFWEGRFKSQALLDEAGLLTAMAYVDLNPLRAGIAATPEVSEFTSIYERIKALASPSVPLLSQEREGGRNGKGEETSTPRPATGEGPGVRVPLHPFRDGIQSTLSKSIPFTLKDYLELLDFTGKHITNPKKASISKKLPSILTRLNIDPTPWTGTMRPSGNLFGRAIGKFDRLRTHAWNLNKDYIHGMALSRKLFGHASKN